MIQLDYSNIFSNGLVEKPPTRWGFELKSQGLHTLSAPCPPNHPFFWVVKWWLAHTHTSMTEEFFPGFAVQPSSINDFLGVANRRSAVLMKKINRILSRWAGPLPVINRVITRRNGLINWVSVNFPPWKWSYFTLLIATGDGAHLEVLQFCWTPSWAFFLLMFLFLSDKRSCWSI